MNSSFAKEEKNYYRDILVDLIGKTNGKPILFSGKFKYRSNESFLTFTCIRPTIHNIKTKTICDHLNFRTEAVSHFYNFSEEVHNRKFYIIGYPSSYSYFGEQRGCVELELNLGIPAVFIVDDFKKYITDDIKEKFYYPSEDQLME